MNPQWTKPAPGVRRVTLMNDPTRPRAAIRLFVSLAVAAALGACSSPSPPPKGLDFRLPDTHGTVRSLSDFRGKWVIVNYWATWCAPCLAEIPQLVRLSKEYRGHKVVVLGIDYEAIGVKKLRAFMKKHHMSYPVLRTSPTDAQQLGPVLGLPTTYLVTPRGELASTQVGRITRMGIEQLIETEALQRGLTAPQHS